MAWLRSAPIPSSDGAVIQKGAERALLQGTTLDDVLSIVARFRETDKATPVVLMGYLNPMEIMGYEKFADSAGAAGVDGVLIVDMPPAESSAMVALLQQQQIDTIFLVAPTTSPKRAAAISQQCSGYLYYVSLKGVTGAAITDTESISRNVNSLRALSDLPIVIGFGIKDDNSAATMAELADGIVIGSALVEKISVLNAKPEQSASDIDTAVNLIGSIRNRIDNIK
jgi:tryptophan synthase alpha chain